MSDTKKIGARIVLDGEAEFRQSINNSKAALKQFDSELKLTAEQFKNNEKSMEALQKVQATYQKQQATLQKQEKAYSAQLEKATKAHSDATKVHEETAKSVENLRKKLEDAKKVYGEDSEEVKKLSQELDKAEDSYKKQEKAISGLETKMIKWETGLNETRTELAKTDKALEEVNHNIDNYDDYIRDAAEETAKANPEIEKLGLSMGQLVGAELIADGIRAMARACVDLAKASIDVGMQFEASMSNVEALSGASGEALDSLRDKARDMGASTIYSASQAADAMGYMALAGWDAKQMIEGIEPVLNLAAAADMELATASDIVTDYLTAFGLEASDAAHFTDMMAEAMSTSNTTVELLGESYKNCAATAHSMGIEVEDVTAVLATMANAGVKGGEAGTALNTILTRLATNTKDCADVLHGYGVEVYDLASGDMNSLSSILAGLSEIWGDLTDKEQANLSKIIAGTNQYSKFQTIMLGVSEAAKEGGQSFYDYADALRDCDGSAKDMADTMQDNLKGKLTILDSALQALGESMYDVFDEELKAGVDGATNAVTRLNDAVKNGDMNASLDKMSKSLGKLIDKVVDWTEKNMPKLIDGLTNVIDNADKIVGAIKGIVAGLVAFKTASTAVTIATSAMALYKAATEGATIAQIAMNVAADANPYILLASVLAGVATATIAWVSSQKEAEHALDGQAEKMQDLADSYNIVSENVKRYAEDNSRYVSSLSAESGYVSDLVKELETLSTKSGQGASDQKRMADIVAELNGQYEDLNLTLEVQNGQLVVSNENWKDLINTKMKEAQVAAVQDKLTEAYAKKYDAEVNLYSAQKDLNDIEKEYGNQLKELEQLYQSDASQEHIDRMYELEQELGPVVEQYTNFKETVENAQESVDEASKSVDMLNGFLEETEDAGNGAKTGADLAADGIESVGEAAEATTGQLVTMSEEFQKQVADLQKSVENSLSSSNAIFEKTKEVEGQNITKMEENIDAHIDQLDAWGKSYGELASRVDDSTGLVLQYIANMGIEGQGYIDQMLTLDDDALNDFTDKMAKALSLPTELASNVADEYTEAVQNAIDGMVRTAEEANADGSPLKTEEKELAEGLANEFKTANGENGEIIGETAKQAVDAVTTAVTEGVEPTRVEAENLAHAVTDPVESNVTYDKFYEIGHNVGEGLAQGIRDSIADVAAAAEELASAAESASKSKLQINSPSKVFMRMGDSIGEGLEKGINRSMKGVVSTLNATLPNEKNVSVGTATSNSEISNNAMNQLSKMLSQYLPQMATNTNVNVTLEGDAKGIFNVVRKENTRIIKSTGYKPLLQ